MNGCPVLRELAVTEDYDREHEQAPVLSGGDYDISAIRSCGEDCRLAAENRTLSLALDDWRCRAAKNAGRIEELREAAEGIWPYVDSCAPLTPAYQEALDRLCAAIGKG
jgi:hypothetical protein